MNVVTRFAPSPTGLLHAGNYRTALFCYIFSLQNKGKFILRIEDSDKARSKREYEDNIVESLKWLGIKYDEFYRQSERSAIHSAYIKKLIDSGHAYVSKETPTEPGGRTEVIRFKNPNKKVIFEDMIRGKIEFDTTELNDFVIARSMEEPVFHLAVVLDDHEAGVTHIIRGEDHISNTPRHILIYEALGLPVPTYAHLPLLLAKDRSKLSKRKGALPITEYRDRGYLPEAILNYMILLGWNPGTDEEMLSLEDMIAKFKIDRVQKGGAIFDDVKLDWFNKKYIEKMSAENFTERAIAFLPEWMNAKSKIFNSIRDLLKQKISKFSEIPALLSAGGELAFARQLNDYAVDMLVWKKNPNKAASESNLKEVREIISKLDENNFTPEGIKNSVWALAEAKGKGEVLWPLRVALTGQEKSPDPFISASLLGKEESLKRIDNAITKIHGA